MKLLPAHLLLILPFSAAISAEEPVWEFTGAAGLAYSDGNSDSSAYSVQFLGSYMRDSDEAYLGLDYFYSEDEAVKGTDSLKIFGQYNHDIAKRFYLGAYGAYFRDSVADIGYRVDPSLLLGYRAIDEEDVKLAFRGRAGLHVAREGWGEIGFRDPAFFGKIRVSIFRHHKVLAVAFLDPTGGGFLGLPSGF